MNRAEKRRKGRGERSYDIYSRLLRERVIMLYGPVGDSSFFVGCETGSSCIFIWVIRFGTPIRRVLCRSCYSWKPRKRPNPFTCTSTLQVRVSAQVFPIYTNRSGLLFAHTGGSVTAGLAIYDTVSGGRKVFAQANVRCRCRFEFEPQCRWKLS